MNALTAELARIPVPLARSARNNLAKTKKALTFVNAFFAMQLSIPVPPVGGGTDKNSHEKKYFYAIIEGFSSVAEM